MLQPGLLFTVPGDTFRHKGAFNSSSSLEILTSSSPDLATPSFWNSETFYFSYLFAPTCHQFVTILFHFPGHFLCFTIQTSQLSFKTFSYNVFNSKSSFRIPTCSFLV